MTVRDWLRGRLPQAPAPLEARILAALGADADEGEARVGELCLAAATRELDTLLSERRFGRDSALALLVTDALMTYAFEHASSSGATREELQTLSQRGARMVGGLAKARD